jgi:3-deoxy-D-manno-octulosonate 8-phosphate phosphatase (KDO 8-P phosphatase)
MTIDNRTVSERARDIRCAVFDVDGVLTDCKLYHAPNGEEWKVTNVRDGLGLKMLMQAGVEVAIISGRPSQAMQHRLDGLGIKHVWLGVADKIPAWESLKQTLGLTDAQMSMMGDDVPDVDLMRRAGLALTTADAHPKALALAQWASRHPGGGGAVREACDLLIAAQART